MHEEPAMENIEEVAVIKFKLNPIAKSNLPLRGCG
jgi:hypothetical protein